MSDEMFVRCCAPTLAGIKTGSMFSCEYSDREEMTDELRRLNRVLSAGGMCILPLRYHDGKALLYLFRPESLQRDMKNRPRGKSWRKRDIPGCGRLLLR